MIGWVSYSAGLAVVEDEPVGGGTEHYLVDARLRSPRPIDKREADRFVRAAPDLMKRRVAEEYPFPALTRDLRYGWQADTVVSACLIMLDPGHLAEEQQELARLASRLLARPTPERRAVERRASKALHDIPLPQGAALTRFEGSEPIHALLGPLVARQHLLVAIQEAWSAAARLTSEDERWVGQLQEQVEQAAYRAALLEAIREDGHLQTFNQWQDKYILAMERTARGRVQRFLDVWMLQLVAAEAGAARALPWLTWYAQTMPIARVRAAFTDAVSRALLRALHVERVEDLLISIAVRAFTGPLQPEPVFSLARHIATLDHKMFVQAFEAYWSIRTAVRRPAAPEDDLAPFALVPPSLIARTFDLPLALMFERTVVPLTTPQEYELGVQLDEVRHVIRFVSSATTRRERPLTRAGAAS